MDTELSLSSGPQQDTIPSQAYFSTFPVCNGHHSRSIRLSSCIHGDGGVTLWHVHMVADRKGRARLDTEERVAFKGTLPVTGSVSPTS